MGSFCQLVTQIPDILDFMAISAESCSEHDCSLLFFFQFILKFYPKNIYFIRIDAENN